MSSQYFPGTPARFPGGFRYRTIVRLSLGDLLDRLNEGEAQIASLAEPQDAIYYTIGNSSLPDFEYDRFRVLFGSTRSYRAVVQILEAVFPRAEGFLRTARPTLPIQIYLTNEEVGTSFTAEVIHEHNHILCVITTQGQELFFVARCVTTYTDSDSNGDESGTLEGTFVSNDEAAAKALANFRQDIEGKEVEGRKEFI
ncbi:MAG: hypothetical protein L6R37_008012 [Teloschistes peruensis]|nr:MAG: hypothetical protein L6R37_008012 [Teloschistes peruensis]